jgi:Ca2+-binding EF-hand superfamily protein
MRQSLFVSGGVMDVTSVSNANTNHKHRLSLAEMLSQTQSTINDDLKAGKLTADQATALKKELDAIAKSLQDARTNGTQISADDRRKMRDELKKVGEDLENAVTAEGKKDVAMNPGLDDLFKKIDTNGDGKIDNSELNNYLSQTAADSPSDPLNASTYNQEGTLSISMTVMESKLSIIA